MIGACAMMVVAAALGVFQIVTRFVLEQPAEWSEILIRFSLIWMVFLGITLAGASLILGKKLGALFR